MPLSLFRCLCLFSPCICACLCYFLCLSPCYCLSLWHCLSKCLSVCLSVLFIFACHYVCLCISLLLPVSLLMSCLLTWYPCFCTVLLASFFVSLFLTNAWLRIPRTNFHPHHSSCLPYIKPNLYYKTFFHKCYRSQASCTCCFSWHYPHPTSFTFPQAEFSQSVRKFCFCTPQEQRDFVLAVLQAREIAKRSKITFSAQRTCGKVYLGICIHSRLGLWQCRICTCWSTQTSVRLTSNIRADTVWPAHLRYS